MARRRWSELTQRTRRIVLLGATFEGILKILALIDIVRRPPEQVRGSRVKWAAAVVLINSLGAVPMAYFLYGRRGAVRDPT
jgi:hypothetical protein